MTRSRRAAPDPGPLYLDPHAVDHYVPAEVGPNIQPPYDQRKAWKKRRSLAHRQPNGIVDPVSQLFVVDTVTRLNTRVRIRARNLMAILDREFPQIAWDAVTIGRILSSLALAAREQQIKTGTPTPHFEKHMDYMGAYYLLWPTPAAYRWLLDLLDKLGGKAETWIRTPLDQRESGSDPILELAAA